MPPAGDLWGTLPRSSGLGESADRRRPATSRSDATAARADAICCLRSAGSPEKKEVTTASPGLARRLLSPAMTGDRTQGAAVSTGRSLHEHEHESQGVCLAAGGVDAAR